MNINDLTIGQAKELASLFNASSAEKETLGAKFIGQKVIIRTYSAGVWFGELSEKSGNEVILINARRMWCWQAAKSISLSAVAVHGIDASKSKIAPAVEVVWLEAIEIIPTNSVATESIVEAKDVEAE